MKTIKFLQLVKYPALLLVAIFGILLGAVHGVPQSLFASANSQEQSTDVLGPQLGFASISGEKEFGKQFDGAISSRDEVFASENPHHIGVSQIGIESVGSVNHDSGIGGGQTAPRSNVLGVATGDPILSLHSDPVAAAHFSDFGRKGASMRLYSGDIISDIGGNQSVPRQ